MYIKKNLMFFSPLEQYDVILPFGPVFSSYFFPQFIVPFLLVFFFSWYFIFIFYKDIYILPTFWQFFFETLILFVLRIIKQQVGSVGYIYMPLVFTFFFFLLSCNLLSLTPFSLALTSHFSIVAFITFTVNLAILFRDLLQINLNFCLCLFPNLHYYY
jgi:F0F1-type ATP synthase membrane subunit a